MTFESALDNEAHAVLEDVGKADIVVGIPSFNNAGTIGHVAGAAIKGITQYFPVACRGRGARSKPYLKRVRSLMRAHVSWSIPI